MICMFCAGTMRHGIAKGEPSCRHLFPSFQRPSRPMSACKLQGAQACSANSHFALIAMTMIGRPEKVS